MPPQRYLEDYLDLVAAVEDTAARSAFAGAGGRLCAAYDPRLHALKVTPDPGVIEVNTPSGRKLG